jgi:hypothetical protein
MSKNTNVPPKTPSVAAKDATGSRGTTPGQLTTEQPKAMAVSKTPDSPEKRRRRKETGISVNDQPQMPPYDYENLVYKDVYNIRAFGGVTAVSEIIGNIIERGAKILYDKYLDAKVPAHTHNFVFDCLAGMLTIQNRVPDTVEARLTQPREEDIAKEYYDAHCPYAMKVDRKEICRSI